MGETDGTRSTARMTILGGQPCRGS
jgi:hypothetical protein